MLRRAPSTSEKMDADPVPPASSPPDPAGFAVRLASLLYDASVFFFFALFLNLAFSVMDSYLAKRSAPSFFPPELYLVFLAVAHACYFAVIPSRSGQTPGMRRFHLRAVTGSGARPPLRSWFARWVGGLLSLATAGIGFVIAAFVPGNRAVQELVSGTYVVWTGGRRPLGRAALMLLLLAAIAVFLLVAMYLPSYRRG